MGRVESPVVRQSDHMTDRAAIEKELVDRVGHRAKVRGLSVVRRVGEEAAEIRLVVRKLKSSIGLPNTFVLNGCV